MRLGPRRGEHGAGGLELEHVEVRERSDTDDVATLADVLVDRLQQVHLVSAHRLDEEVEAAGRAADEVELLDLGELLTDAPGRTSDVQPEQGEGVEAQQPGIDAAGDLDDPVCRQAAQALAHRVSGEADFGAQGGKPHAPVEAQRVDQSPVGLVEQKRACHSRP